MHYRFLAYPAAALLALLAGSVRAEVLAFHDDYAAWAALAPDRFGYAFEQHFPQHALGNAKTGCLSEPGTSAVALTGGALKLTLSDGNCAVVDGSSGGPYADAAIPKDQTLTLNFDPPVRAFYGYFGSLAAGKTVTATLRNVSGAEHAITDNASQHSVQSAGFGFVSSTPIAGVAFSSNEPGTAILGRFVETLPNQSVPEQLPAATRCGPTGKPTACDFVYAYDSAFDAAAGDQFGHALALDGDTLAVGAPLAGDAAPAAGRVLLFSRDPSSADGWRQTQQLGADHAGAGDQFGFSIALHGDLLAIGAPFGDGGAVYVYLRDPSEPSNWRFSHRLTAENGASGDRFGYALSVFDDEVLVGAPFAGGVGAAYWFNATQGAQTTELRTQPYVASGRTRGALFGSAVALRDGLALIGAPGGAGSASLFRRDDDASERWQRVQKLTAPGDAAGDAFGAAVALSSGASAVALVGAPLAVADAAASAGAVYLFADDPAGAGVWHRTQILIADDATDDAQFGASLSVDGGAIAVGARRDGERDGAIYLFSERASVRTQRGDREWELAHKLTAAGTAASGFGSAVALNGEAMVAGAPFDDALGESSGSTYGFQREWQHEQSRAGRWRRVITLVAGGP